MIYFLINNNYHYHDCMQHLEGLDASNISILEVPHSLDRCEQSGFHRVIRFVVSFKFGLIGQVLNYLRTARRISQIVCPAPDDILLLYTEYEIVNLHFVSLFRKAGARIYLIEDGGLATYVPFRIVEGEKLSLRERIRHFVYRALPELSKIEFHKINGIVFPRMPDKFFDGLCIYRPVTYSRSIPPVLLRYPIAKPAGVCVKGRVVFLNEMIYAHYQSAKSYLAGLYAILFGLTEGFREVYFKFHPRETKEWRDRISTEVLAHLPSVALIENNSAFEAIVEEYRPESVASYFAAPLLNISDQGIEPIYLYHLIPDLAHQRVFLEVSSILSELGYQFIPDFGELRKGYRAKFVRSECGLPTRTLAEFIAAA